MAPAIKKITFFAASLSKEKILKMIAMVKHTQKYRTTIEGGGDKPPELLSKKTHFSFIKRKKKGLKDMKH